MSRQFDGSANAGVGQYLISPFNPIYQNMVAFTLAAWVYLLPTVAQSMLFAKGSPHPSQSVFCADFLGTGTGQNVVMSNVLSDLSNPASFSSDQVPFGSWTHVAGTYNASGDGIMRLYINGKETGYLLQIPGNGTPFPDVSEGWLFGGDRLPSEGLTGNMADIRIFNTTLSQPQIAQIASGSSVASASLMGWWKLEGTQPEPDSSGHGDILTTNGPVISATTPTVLQIGSIISCSSLPGNTWSVIYQYNLDAGGTAQTEIVVGSGIPSWTTPNNSIVVSAPGSSNQVLLFCPDLVKVATFGLPNQDSPR